MSPGERDAFQAALVRGATLADQERFAEAVDAFREAVKLQPKAPQAHLALAYALSRVGKPRDGELSALEAIALAPSADGFLLLAHALLLQRRFAESEPAARKAITMRPSYALAHSVLAISLQGLARFDEAEAAFRRAIEIDPKNGEFVANFGRLRFEQRRFAQAIELFDRALALRPTDRETHFALAGALLLTGNYARGFHQFEYRWSASYLAEKRRTFDKPRWDGSPLNGRTILVHSEQGFGDLFQFARFVPMLVERGAGKVLVEAQPAAAELIRSVDGVSEVVTRSDRPSGAYDVYLPLMSLPAALGITLANLPARVPYLHVDQARMDHWREKLAHLPGKRIGIAWAGNREHDRDEHRSIRSSLLSPLANVPIVTFVSLQLPRDTRARPEDLPLFDPTPDIKDFSDTAAIIENLDLVIGVDTALVHLAGALAKPVWTLIDFDNDWRWMIDRDDTPWYPTMRLFRQKTAGDWNGVIARVRDELVKL